MNVVEFNYDEDISQRFHNARKDLLDFTTLTLQKLDRLKKEQESLAYGYRDKTADERNNLLAGQLAYQVLDALHFLTLLDQASQPLIADKQQRIQTAEENIARWTGERSSEYNGELYVEQMVVQERRRELEQFKALLLGDIGNTQAALFKMHSTTISTWETRGSIDRNKAAQLASANVAALREGITQPFMASPLSQNAHAMPAGSQNTLPSAPSVPPTEYEPPPEANSMPQVLTRIKDKAAEAAAYNTAGVHDVTVSARTAHTTGTTGTDTITGTVVEGESIDFSYAQGGHL